MQVATISPQEWRALRQRGQGLPLIDVRTPAEFAAVHVDGAINVPLDSLDAQSLGLSREQAVYVICQSGARAARACERLAAGGWIVSSISDGTAGCEEAGLPLVRGERKVLSLERQVRIAAGCLVLVGVLLGFLVHPAFFSLAAFVGAGLVFAGVTDFCGMAMLLARMPWNRRGSPAPPGCCN